MIIGIGNDMIDIRRIEQSLEKYGDRFTNRVFTSIEREKSDKRANRVASYAKRFAAKEACSKALGTGFSNKVFMSDIGVVNAPTGKPSLELTGGAADYLLKITPINHIPDIQLTITDDFPWAQAIVIISAYPAKHTSL